MKETEQNQNDRENYMELIATFQDDIGTKSVSIDVREIMDGPEKKWLLRSMKAEYSGRERRVKVKK